MLTFESSVRNLSSIHMAIEGVFKWARTLIVQTVTVTWSFVGVELSRGRGGRVRLGYRRTSATHGSRASKRAIYASDGVVAAVTRGLGGRARTDQETGLSKR